MDPERTRHARALFAGIAPEYDRMGSVLSFGRDPSWRRFLVSRVNAIAGSWVLVVATGTGLVARELAARNVRVVGVDQSPAMLRRGEAAVRRDGLAGVPRAAGPLGAGGLVRVHPRRAPVDRRRRVERVVSDGAVHRPEHQRVLPALSGSGSGADVAGGRGPGRLEEATG